MNRPSTAIYRMATLLTVLLANVLPCHKARIDPRAHCRLQCAGCVSTIAADTGQANPHLVAGAAADRAVAAGDGILVAGQNRIPGAAGGGDLRCAHRQPAGRARAARLIVSGPLPSTEVYRWRRFAIAPRAAPTPAPRPTPNETFCSATPTAASNPTPIAT